MEAVSQELRLERMRRFFDSGATLGYEARRQALVRFREQVIANEQAIFDALMADLNKSPEEAYVTENGLLLQEIRYALKKLRRWMRPRKVGTNLMNFPSSSRLYPGPRGVVLIIGPWNFPLQLVMLPLVGAIAAGNCAVLKPSELAPASAAIIEKIVRESFPPGWVDVWQGDGAIVVPYLMERFRFDHVFYTGSIPVGRAVYQLAARDLVPVTLELGGKNACVVEADANIKVAAKRIVTGKFTNAGQMCVSPDYLLVHEQVKDQLLDEMKKAISHFYGEPVAGSYGYCRIVNEKKFDRLLGFMAQGSVITGGQFNREKLIIAPTLMEQVDREASLMQEEIFGPLLPVFSFGKREEALELIHRYPQPLSFYVFTGNRRKADEWMQACYFGNGCVNNIAWQVANHHLPFGGVGSSGIGAYHGRHSFDLFSHFKAVMKTPAWFDPAFKYPPLKGKLPLIRKFLS